MADLDTASKRGSSLRFQRSWSMQVPLPDSTIAQGDRQHHAYAYSGIAAAGAAAFKVAWAQGRNILLHRRSTW